MIPLGSGCPRCGDALVRMPRRPLDRIWSWLVETRRVRCHASECGFRGLVVAQVKDEAVFVLLLAAAMMLLALVL